MIFPFDVGPRQQPAFLSVLSRLKDLFDQMDQKYNETAGRYGFQCTGCSENCCETRFHHHTIIEYAFLLCGIATLANEVRADAVDRARRIIEKTLAADKAQKKIRLMCPLNLNQRCLVYPYRPMICRLHGIAHELHPPNGGILRGEGCRQFDECAQGKPYLKFDRTPFYREMAQLEREARALTELTGKIKLTVAEMLSATGSNVQAIKEGATQ